MARPPERARGEGGRTKNPRQEASQDAGQERGQELSQEPNQELSQDPRRDPRLDPRDDPRHDPWAAPTPAAGSPRRAPAAGPRDEEPIGARPQAPRGAAQNWAEEDRAEEDWAEGWFEDAPAAGATARRPLDPAPPPAAEAPKAAPVAARARRLLRLGDGAARAGRRNRRLGANPVLARLAGAAALGLRGGLALAAAFGVAAAALGAPWAVEELRRWRDAAAVEVSPPAVGALFDRLVGAGLVRLDPRGFGLTLAPADLALRRKLPGAADDGWPMRVAEEDARALGWAHGDGAGRALRAEIAAWNAALRTAAIRESRSGAWRAETVFIPAERGGDRADLGAPGFPVRVGAAPPADRYGYFGWSAPDRPAPTGPWLRAAPAAGFATLVAGAGAGGPDRDADPDADPGAGLSETVRVRFLRTAGADEPSPDPDRPLVVDVLGRFPRVAGAEVLGRFPLCGAEAVAARADAAAADPSRAVSVSFRRRAAPVCGAPDLQGPSDGHRLLLNPTGGPFAVSVEPAPSPPERLRPYQGAPLIAEPPADALLSPRVSGWVAYRGSPALTLWCGPQPADAAAPGPACAMVWTPPTARRLAALYRVPERAGAPLPGRAPSGPPPPPSAAPTPDAPDRRPRLETADGVALLSADGRPTAAAAELGLLSLTGLGPRDRFGLSAALPLSLTQAIGPARLTVRADWQRKALAALAELERDPALRNRLPKRLDPRRRAVLTVLDASEDPRRRGAILAAAVVQPGAAETAARLAAAAARDPRAVDGAAWNALGYDLWRPRASPLAPRAWSRADSRAAPGSTLKTLTSLALIRAAAAEEFDPARREPLKGPLHAAIEGVADPARAPGLPLPPRARIAPEGWVEIPGRFWAPARHDCVAGRSGLSDWRDVAKICNFVFQGRLEPHAYGHLPPEATGCPPRPGGAADQAQLGLCEATTTSLNSWFIAAALALSRRETVAAGLETGSVERAAEAETSDPDASADPEAAGPLRARAGLARLAARFPGPDARNLARRKAPPAARFRAEALRFDPVSDQPLFQLGLLSIGQNVQSPPLSIAALYGAIGAGCRLDPHLLARPNDRAAAEAGCRPLLFDPATDPDLDDGPAGRDAARRRETYALSLIRERLTPGLRAVVAAERGTADAAFRGAPYAQWLRGKTGTAEAPLPDALGGGLSNTVWFAGWAEPEAFTDAGGPGLSPAGRPRRIAFACMVTDAKGTGGTICAPIVRAFLDALRRAGAAEPAGSAQETGGRR